jgi:hypothetical protein
MNKYFDFNRLFHVMNRQYRLNQQTLWIATGALGGLLLVTYVLRIVFGFAVTPEHLIATAFPFIFLGGFLFSTLIYSELQNPGKSCFYLLLPASNAEKFISAWILSSPAFVIFSSAILWSVSLVLFYLQAVVLNTDFQVLNLWHHEIPGLYLKYLIIQPVFLLGALYFKRKNFLKTILSMFLVAMVILMYTGALQWLLFWQDGENLMASGANEHLFMEWGQTVARYSKYAFYYFIGPFFLIAGYFSLKEREV